MHRAFPSLAAFEMNEKETQQITPVKTKEVDERVKRSCSFRVVVEGGGIQRIRCIIQNDVLFFIRR